MPNKNIHDDDDLVVGRAHPEKKPRSKPEGTERSRDEAREDSGPRYGSGPWRVADERGDRRHRHARNDDADPSELGGEAEHDDDESPSAVDPDLAAAEEAGEIESGGQQAGMRRGEEPRRPKQRAKPNAKKSDGR